MKQNNKRSAWIWLSVIALLICLCVSAVVLAGQMRSFTPDDSGAIPLVPDRGILNNSNQNTSASATQNVTNVSEDSASAPDNKAPGAVDGADTSQQQTHPGFEVNDDNTAWCTNTEVEIFRVSYENGQHVVTVKSADGQKIIAPGTENSYTFKLKNTGDVALDCNVKVDAYFTPAGFSVPIKGRVSRYDGKWVVGSANSYADVDLLDKTEDSMTLAAGRYIYYTLDWMWPYESDDDALDTLIGNMAADEELTFTIVITTTATESDGQGGGILSPNTGDSGYTLWILLLVVSLAVLLLLLFAPKRGKAVEKGDESNLVVHGIIKIDGDTITPHGDTNNVSEENR